MSDVSSPIRDAIAKRAAERQYAEAYDKFAELEQRYASRNPIEAAGARGYALICKRAYVAEMRDPSPKEQYHRDREGEA